MSTVLENERYPTPESAVRALLLQMAFRPDDRFLEPCRGVERRIYNLVPLPEDQKFFAEIDEGVDYLKTTFEKMDVIITNPPFSLTEEFLMKSFSELKSDGTLIYLQRVNFFGSKKRVDFWDKVTYPEKTPILIPRPRFVTKGGKRGTDSCEYTWMIWDKGGRLPHMVNGISNIRAIEGITSFPDSDGDRKLDDCRKLLHRVNDLMNADVINMNGSNLHNAIIDSLKD